MQTPEVVRRVKVIRPPSFSPLRLVGDLRDLAGYGDLLYTLSLHRIHVRYKQSLLGLAWAILQPLSLALVYTVIFRIVTRMPSNGLPYPVFAYCALLPWTFFSTSLTNSSSGMIGHTQLITKVYFPREIIPLTYVIAGLADLVIASTVLAGMMAFYGIRPTWQALYVVPILLVAILFTAALALIFSAVQVRFRDIGLALPLLLQLWMFASPVVYPLSAVPRWLRGWYELNPLAGVVEGFRRVLLEGKPPDFPSLEIAATISVVLLPLCYLFFKNREATMADII